MYVDIYVLHALKVVLLKDSSLHAMYSHSEASYYTHNTETSSFPPEFRFPEKIASKADTVMWRPQCDEYNMYVYVDVGGSCTYRLRLVTPHTRIYHGLLSWQSRPLRYRGRNLRYDLLYALFLSARTPRERGPEKSANGPSGGDIFSSFASEKRFRVQCYQPQMSLWNILADTSSSPFFRLSSRANEISAHGQSSNMFS